MRVRRALAIASAFYVQAQGQQQDRLEAWQAEYWRQHENVLFAVITDAVPSDYLGVFAFVGEHAIANFNNELNRYKDVPSNPRGFVKPFEFYWRTAVSGRINGKILDMSVADALAYTFSVTPLDKGTGYLLRSVARPRVFFFVEQFDGRWVALAKHEGSYFMVHYMWVNAEISFLGVPTGVDYINVHGFPVDTVACTVDYNQSVVLRWNEDSDWELGILDNPLCFCRSTCFVSPPTAGSCVAVMTEMLTAMAAAGSYKAFINAITSHSASEYQPAELARSACERLPELLTLDLKEDLQACSHKLVLDMEVANGVGSLPKHPIREFALCIDSAQRSAKKVEAAVNTSQAKLDLLAMRLEALSQTGPATPSMAIPGILELVLFHTLSSVVVWMLLFAYACRSLCRRCRQSRFNMPAIEGPTTIAEPRTMVGKTTVDGAC